MLPWRTSRVAREGLQSEGVSEHITDGVLFVIDGDPRELAAFERVLRRCYGAGCNIFPAEKTTAGGEAGAE